METRATRMVDWHPLSGEGPGRDSPRGRCGFRTACGWMTVDTSFLEEGPDATCHVDAAVSGLLRTVSGDRV